MITSLRDFEFLRFRSLFLRFIFSRFPATESRFKTMDGRCRIIAGKPAEHLGNNHAHAVGGVGAFFEKLFRIGIDGVDTRPPTGIKPEHFA